MQKVISCLFVFCLIVLSLMPASLLPNQVLAAADSSTVWDLRCEVREKLVGFIQNKYPDALPKPRAELRAIGHD